jgi:phosphatidate cytidylyltransferase
VNVRYNNRERDIPWFRSLQWAWFCVAVVYLYGDLAISLCMRGAPVIWGHDRSFYEHWHKKLTFLSYSTVFVITVLSMKKGFYRYQMNQLAWTLLTLVMVVAQMHSMILNVIEGLFWFVIPTMLVIVNDSAAYFVGFTTGRRFIDHEKHPFLKLSPNKTWEGFIGGGLLTIIAGFYLPLLFAGSEWLVCRPEGLSLWSSEPLTCEPAPQFSPATYSLPMLENTTITCLPVQLQVLMLAVFASVVAPFGGFFASAIKRAYDAKDFDTFIPGHGGLMDRLDCQFIMGLWYVRPCRGRPSCSSLCTTDRIAGHHSARLTVPCL